MKTTPLSPDQLAAESTILNSVSKHDQRIFYLTGPPGCGKSFLTRRLLSHVGEKRSRVVAPTGAAAHLVGGTTIHRFFKLNFRKLFDAEGGLIRKPEDFACELRQCRLFVVDELSMVNAGYLKIILTLLGTARPTILLVGDFLQLQPINVESLPPEFSRIAYQSVFWPAVTTLHLRTNHRQSGDELYRRALGDLRVGNITPAVRSLIANRQGRCVPPQATHVYPTRRMVAKENYTRLQSLGNTIHVIHSSKRLSNGHRTKKRVHLDKRPQVPYTIRTAVGARIMFLNNHPADYWYNGLMGTVCELIRDPTKRGAIVELIVETDFGVVLCVPKWTFDLCNSKGEVIGSYAQFPVQLAWALTVHKVQGRTLGPVLVDLSNHFAPGMTYVALSRCRDSKDLFLRGSLDYCRVNPETLARFQHAQ